MILQVVYYMGMNLHMNFLAIYKWHKMSHP